MRTIFICGVCVAIGIAADALFLPHQSLWNDEATQMSGLTLDPAEVTRWLADRVDYDFGVPDDRMPPLSYWVGWIWSKATGLGERPMRWLGVICVAMATAVVYAATRRAWGLTAGAAAALLLSTSPNVVTTAVEIRAYPMLILASAGLYACLVGYTTGAPGSRRRWLAGLLACGIAAMYTHFFGLVALGGALVAVFVFAWANKESVMPALAAGGVTAVAALGLIPFIFASTGLSTATGPADGKLLGIVRLGYRLFSHPAMSIGRGAVILAAVAFFIGIACGLAPKVRWSWTAGCLGLAVVSGAAVVALAHLAQSAFEAARPSYNVWMLPPLAILIASGLAARARPIRFAAMAAVLVSLATNLYADAQLAIHGDALAHTAYGPISDFIRRLGPDQVAVVHDGDTGQAWHIYSPIRYEFAGKVRQFRILDEGRDPATVRLTEYPLPRGDFDPTELPVPNIIVVRSVQWFAKDLADQIRRGATPLGDGPAARALLASGRWERVEEKTYLGFVGADIDVFRKIATR